MVVPRLIRDREAGETVREETMGGIAQEGGLLRNLGFGFSYSEGLL